MTWRVPNRRRGNKFNAVRRLGYDSNAEAARAAELRLLEAAGEISELREHHRLEIQPDGCKRVWYVADFTYQEHGQFTIEDVKGILTPLFRLKWKLCKHKYPEARFRISKRSTRRGGGFIIRDEVGGPI